MFVFVCWTPYQVFNAINFVMNDVEGARGNTDIYIYHDFGNSLKLSEQLKKADIFCHVYDIEVYDKRKKIWYSKFNKIKRLLMPYSTVKHFLKADIDVRKQGYKTLVISGNNLFSINMYNCIKGLQVYFIDDGTGTYFGDLRERDITLLYKIFNKLFGRGPMSYDVKKLYINNKEICRSTICENVEQLPDIVKDSETDKSLCRVFDYKESDAYSKNRFIYLTQPLFETSAGQSAEVTEQNILSRLNGDLLLRVHPRQNKEEYSGYTVDETNNLWELECVRHITDDHVLIGGFSTAQFMPKILSGAEPTLIFTYKLYGDIMPTADDTIALLKTVYKDQSKIVVVETMDELDGILKKI